jgi:predicted DNA repair protein MutK
MAVANLLSVLEDITTMLDQVAAATKIAAKKTAGVVADDMALNAQQVVGVPASRELSVVWAVAKGSLLNKLIITPALLAISALAPGAVKWLLLVGGAFLCFEGFEKVVHKLLHSKEEDEAHKREHLAKAADPAVDLAQSERDKVKGAVRTDFILSAEIAVISLGAVASSPLGIRVGTLIVVGLAMTVGVYGLVAMIVRFDDVGVWLSRREGEGGSERAQRALGRGVLRSAPWIMRALSFLGTLAMFLVGGSIVSHNVAPVHHVAETVTAKLAFMGQAVATTTTDLLVGLLTGLACVLVVTVAAKASRLWRKTKA